MAKSYKNNYRSKNSKSKQNTRNKASKDCEIRDPKSEEKNHPEWMLKYPELARAAGNLAFGHPVGVPMDLDTRTGIGEFTPPSIMTLAFTPTIGSTGLETDAINLAAKQNYTFIRAINSGAKNYDPVDVMMYYLALDQVTMAFEWIKRAYGAINAFSAWNRKLPKGFIDAMGLDYDDLVEHRGEIWFQLNYWASQLSSFVIPRGISYLDRHKFMCQNIYCDDNTQKTQYYIFNPVNFYKFDEKYEKGGTLYPIYNLPSQEIGVSNFLTWDQAKTMIDNMIQVLLASEDILGNISGDILKAWGMEAIHSIEAVPVDYSTPIVRDIAMLWQIRNASVVGSINYEIPVVDQDILSGQIYQDSDGLIKQYIVLKDLPESIDETEVRRRDPRILKQLITTDSAIPSSEEVLYDTRLTVMCDYEVVPYDENVRPVVKTCGSEVINHIIVNRDHIRQGSVQFQVFTRKENGEWVTVLPGQEADGWGAFYNTWLFDYAPRVTLVQVHYNEFLTFQSSETHMKWDIDNYSCVDVEKLKQMHDATMMSYFKVPSPGKL